MVHSEHIVRKRWSKNPLEDGAYRVFIYRPSADWDPDPDGLWLSAFMSLNGFDDVFVVPPEWGMEAALNEIAARGIPINELYIGSHSDAFLMGELLMDYDRRLVFAKGARVVFTGCRTTRETAELLGAQLFLYSAGTLVWGEGKNIPLPFSGWGLLGMGERVVDEKWNERVVPGDVYETTFELGVPRETRPQRLIDPIPGGLF